MSEIRYHLDIDKPWVVKTPRVYRYLGRRWVDEFFATGSIQLSSFAKFRENPHERTGDKNEGDGILVGTNDKQTIYSVVNYIPVAYVMSTSLRFSREIAAECEYDGCFRINDTLGFSAAIAKCIPQCKGGVEGFCSYTARRAIHMKIDELQMGGPAPAVEKILASYRGSIETALIFAKGLTYVN